MYACFTISFIYIYVQRNINTRTSAYTPLLLRPFFQTHSCNELVFNSFLTLHANWILTEMISRENFFIKWHIATLFMTLDSFCPSHSIRHNTLHPIAILIQISLILLKTIEKSPISTYSHSVLLLLFHRKQQPILSVFLLFIYLLNKLFNFLLSFLK